MRLKLQVALRLFALSALFALGCRTAPKEQPPASPPPLALETFDAVWRIVHETHFDTTFNGHNWLEVKEKYRPRVERAATQREVRAVIGEMLKLLEVSHLMLVPGELVDEPPAGRPEDDDEEGSGSVGMDVRYAGTNLIVTAVEPGFPASEAGVQPGWIVKTIGGRNTSAFWSKVPGTVDERRRAFLAWQAVSKRLSGAPSSQVEIEFLTGANESKKMSFVRRLESGQSVQFGLLAEFRAHLVSSRLRTNDLSIGLIRFNYWMPPTALAFHRAIDEHRQRDGIIIDLRGNVGGMVAMIMGVAGHFVTEPQLLGTMKARDNTLRLPANPRYSDSAGKPVRPFTGPLAILVDEITASASEVFAGGLQELGRARIFGRTTAGAAVPAIPDNLPNGDLLFHPMADFVTPKGTRFEGRGVIPDVEVPLDRAALLRGMDPAIEAAKSWIAGEQRPRGSTQ